MAHRLGLNDNSCTVACSSSVTWYSQDQKFVCFWNASSPFSTPFYSSLQIFITKTESAKASEFNVLMIHFLNFDRNEWEVG